MSFCRLLVSLCVRPSVSVTLEGGEAEWKRKRERDGKGQIKQTDDMELHSLIHSHTLKIYRTAP
jgi:hypothetical protein